MGHGLHFQKYLFCPTFALESTQTRHFEIEKSTVLESRPHLILRSAARDPAPHFETASAAIDNS